jgi:hypothetical protein
MAHDITDCQCPGCVYRRYVDAGLTVEQLPKEYQNVPTLHAFELKYGWWVSFNLRLSWPWAPASPQLPPTSTHGQPCQRPSRASDH